MVLHDRALPGARTALTALFLGPRAARGPSNSPQSQDHEPTHRSVSNLLAAACSCCFPLKCGTGRQGDVSSSCGVSTLHTPSSSSSQQTRNPRSRRVPSALEVSQRANPGLGPAHLFRAQSSFCHILPPAGPSESTTEPKVPGSKWEWTVGWFQEPAAVRPHSRARAGRGKEAGVIRFFPDDIKFEV